MDFNEPAPRGERGKSNIKMWLGLGIGAAFVVGFGVFFFVTRDQQVSPPRIIGNVWTAAVDGATRVYYVTREDRAETRAFDVRGRYTYEHSYSIYRLAGRNAADGSLAGEVQIARIETTSPDFKRYRAYVTLPDGPGILGPQADVLWLWNGGIEARSLKTLEAVWTEGQLREKNPQFAANLPDDPRYTRMIGGLGALVIKSRDARYLSVNRETGVFEPVDETKLAAFSLEHTKTADSAFTSARPRGESLRSTSVSGLVWNSIIDHGTWYGLLTGDERARLTPRLGVLEEWYFRHSQVRESASQLYRGKYAMEAGRIIQRTSVELKTESVTPLGSERFIMAGILRRPESNYDAWVLPARVWTAAAAATSGRPAVESFVVISREAIGNESAWQLSRVGVDGTVAWKSSIGLTEIEHMNDGHGAIVVTGQRAGDSAATGERPDRMVFVDEASGRVAMVNVATGEMGEGK